MRCALLLWFNFKSKARIDSGRFRGSRRLGRWLRLAAFGILSVRCILAASGAVTGSVVDDTGKPFAGARVLISYAPTIRTPVAAPPVVTGALAATIGADGSGSFRTDSLPPGQYVACAETTTPGYLDPCHWATSAPTFTVIAGQTTSGVSIVMAKGAVLHIHVDDPQQLLGPASGPVDLNLQIHVVTASGLHYSAPIQSSSAVARDHAITIPFGAPLTLRVLASHLVVNDQSGKAFAALGAALNVPAGTTPAVVGLTIAGKN